MEGQSSFLKYEKFFRIGLIAIIAIALILIIVLGIVVPAIQKANQATTVEFGIAPSSATITVNGETYSSGVYDNFAPGTYTAEITATGFESKTVNFTVVEHEANTVFAYLYNYAEGLDFFLASDVDIAILRKIDDAEVQAWLAAYDQMLSIRDQLSYEVTVEYTQTFQYSDLDGSMLTDTRLASTQVTINDGSALSNCPYAFCLQVTPNGISEDLAAPEVESAIVEMGYNPDDYYIIYQ